MIHKDAGKVVKKYFNVPRLLSLYYVNKPEVNISTQKVSFGTSGHRGSSIDNSFNEAHILAISQALVEYRKSVGISGPLFIGMDTHALSEAAFITATEVFVAAGIELMVDRNMGYTPTPAVSLAILNYNRNRKTGLADGVIISPSHNPPRDGGFKYNPPSGGPADTAITKIIEDRANELLAEPNKIERLSFSRALKADNIHKFDYIGEYLNDLENVVDMQVISDSGLKIAVDPMGGAGIDYWQPIADKYSLDITITNKIIDSSFGFMPLDKDGVVRMDCSSPYAMAKLLELKDKYDISFGNDPDFDRHGVVTKAGLMNPNHYLAVAIDYLFQNRPAWPKTTAVGKTLVSSSMIDKVAKKLDRKIYEVPVGFKWFVEGLVSGKLGFGGEESAGASFLRKNGSVWTTDKDGIIMDLLAAEIFAKTDRSPAEHYKDLEKDFGKAYYSRISSSANTQQKEILKNLQTEDVKADTLAGEKILAKLTTAPANNMPIGGLKVATKNAWFAARPSGTEDIYKIYAESFISAEHLEQVESEAQMIVERVLPD